MLDGGSTDGTREFLERYARGRRALRLVFEKDGGQSAAMNRGIALARGSVLGFLNADDGYEAGTLRHVRQVFQCLPEPTLLVGACRVVDARGETVAWNRPRRFTLADLLWGNVFRPHPYNPSSYFYHRSLHQRIGRYDESDHHTMDLDFLLRAVTVANLAQTDRALGYFRWAPGTKSWEDRRKGTSFARKEAVFRRHEASLATLPRVVRRYVRWLTDTGLPAAVAAARPQET